MIADDGFDGLLAFEGLLFGAEQLDADALAQRIEIFIKEQFLHFFVDGAQLLEQDSPHDGLFLFPFDVLLPAVQNFSERVLEPRIKTLCLCCDGLNRRANHLCVLLFVVSPQEGHFFDNSEQEVQHVGAVE